MRERPEARERPIPGKKDTKRWCRGKVGVEHVLEIRANDPKWRYTEQRCGRSRWLPGHRWLCYEQEHCVTCGKILRHSLGDDCTVKTPCG